MKPTSTIDWAAVAKRLKYDSERSMWTTLYMDKGMSLPELASRFGVTMGAVRLALLRNKVPMRSRGGRRVRTPVLTADQVIAYKREGLKTVALRLDITYYEIRKRINAAEDVLAATARRSAPAPPASKR